MLRLGHGLWESGYTPFFTDRSPIFISKTLVHPFPCSISCYFCRVNKASISSMGSVIFDVIISRRCSPAFQLLFACWLTLAIFTKPQVQVSRSRRGALQGYSVYMHWQERLQDCLLMISVIICPVGRSRPTLHGVPSIEQDSLGHNALYPAGMGCEWLFVMKSRKWKDKKQ